MDLSLGPTFGDAVAWAPGGVSARPLVIAVHVNRDRPEWPCWRWSRIVGDRAFVLCPRGVPRTDDPSRFTFSGADSLQKEIEAGVAAPARYGDRGGAARWEPWVATAFAKQGGKRVLFACGQVACVGDAKSAIARAKAVEGRVVLGQGGGHHFYGPVADAIENAFDWVVADDPDYAAGV